MKKIVAEPQCLNVFIKLANACLTVGRWPKHFKESVSVIIPKPSKPSYSAPKAFRPIALLNTLWKFIEKMLSNCIQYNMITYNLVEKSTSYTWNTFVSDLRLADVGVRQGSALSLVLSALFQNLETNAV